MNLVNNDTFTENADPFCCDNLTELDLQLIEKNEWLEDSHIMFFCSVLSKISKNEHVPCSYIEDTSKVRPIKNKEVDHILILHDGSSHWICCYYDTKRVTVYDSLNHEKLNSVQYKFLQRLYPHIIVDSTSVKFAKVHKQPNFIDCGVFAIAYAISITYGFMPESIKYDEKKMRKHLRDIFERSVIEHFPIDVSCQNQVAVPTLQTALEERNLKYAITDENFVIAKKNMIASLNNNRQCDKPMDALLNQKASHLKKGSSMLTTATIRKEHEFLNSTASHLTLTSRQTKLKSNNIKSTREEGKRDDDNISAITDLPDLKDLNVRKIIQSVEAGGWLNNDVVMIFHALIKRGSTFFPQDTLFVETPSRIKEIPRGQRNVQILYSPNHWVCSYYDSSSVYIYDSLNNEYLHPYMRRYLRCLYPYLDMDSVIKFPKVQQQSNMNDCCVFAIAFAVSVLFDEKPENMYYSPDLMRSHVVQMIKSCNLSRFPTR